MIVEVVEEMIERTYSREDLSLWNLPELSPEELKRAEKASQELCVNVIASIRAQMDEWRERFREKIDDTTRYVYCSPANYLDVAMTVATINPEIKVVKNRGIKPGNVYFLPECGHWRRNGENNNHNTEWYKDGDNGKKVLPQGIPSHTPCKPS